MSTQPSILALRDRLQAAFEANFAAGRELGAAVSVWLDGEEIVHLCAGKTHKDRESLWSETTLAPVYSATKGPAAACLLQALDSHGLDLDTHAIRIWPQLPPHLSVGEILSHQAGLAALTEPAEALNYPAVIRALECTEPAWTPPAHGYHPRTFGYLVDEFVRRITGAESLGAYWQETFARPYGIDFWIGLPESEHGRVAKLYPGRPDVLGEESRFYDAFNQPGSATRRAFFSPSGLHSVAEMNQPTAWMAGLPGFGGVGSARGLAQFYALLATRHLLSDRALSWASTRLVNGPDRTFLMPSAFSAGFMLDPLDAHGHKLRRIFGPEISAFGHPGAGGSHAFVAPQQRLSFAYVMNQMELSVLPQQRVQNLVQAVFAGPIGKS